MCRKTGPNARPAPSDEAWPPRSHETQVIDTLTGGRSSDVDRAPLGDRGAGIVALSRQAADLSQAPGIVIGAVGTKTSAQAGCADHHRSPTAEHRRRPGEQPRGWRDVRPLTPIQVVAVGAGRARPEAADRLIFDELGWGNNEGVALTMGSCLDERDGTCPARGWTNPSSDSEDITDARGEGRSLAQPGRRRPGMAGLAVFIPGRARLHR